MFVKSDKNVIYSKMKSMIVNRALGARVCCRSLLLPLLLTVKMIQGMTCKTVLIFNQLFAFLD